MMRRRRPLLRAGMVGGVAYHAAVPAGGLSEAAIAQLKELAQLKHDGVLTPEEFAGQKARLLGS